MSQPEGPASGPAGSDVPPPATLVEAGPVVVEAGPVVVEAGPVVVEAGPVVVEAGPGLPGAEASRQASVPGTQVPASRSFPEGDYRALLGSRRWDAAPLRNPEVEKTDPRIAVAAIVILASVTLIVLVAGYASGFWSLPDTGTVSGAVAALELLA